MTNRHTGERTTLETVKCVNERFWINYAGKIKSSVRYGSKTLELAKGKSAIELATSEELIAVLDKFKAAVLAGELDTQIEAGSRQLRAGFAN